jgi:hypothetical protein
MEKTNTGKKNRSRKKKGNKHGHTNNNLITHDHHQISQQPLTHVRQGFGNRPTTGHDPLSNTQEISDTAITASVIRLSVTLKTALKATEVHVNMVEAEGISNDFTVYKSLETGLLELVDEDSVVQILTPLVKSLTKLTSGQLSLRKVMPLLLKFKSVMSNAGSKIYGSQIQVSGSKALAEIVQNELQSGKIHYNVLVKHVKQHYATYMTHFPEVIDLIDSFIGDQDRDSGHSANPMNIFM